MKLSLHLHRRIHAWLLLQVHFVSAIPTGLHRARDAAAPHRSPRLRTDRGSVTIEQVIWAGAVIVIVGIVVAAITGYVTTQAGKIQ